MDFWRVRIIDMMGVTSEEYFFDVFDDAERKFEGILKDKRNDVNTLTDEECRDNNMQEENFGEFPVMNFDKTSFIKTLRQVMWSYGLEMKSQEDVDYNYYTDMIVLEEIRFG